MPQIRHTVTFQSPPDTVFDFVATLGHWPQWYPATRAVEGQSLCPVVQGDTVVERVVKFGLQGTLGWVVVEARRPSLLAIATTSIDMPLFGRARFTIRYDFESDGHGTRMVRRWDYEIPGWLRLPDRLFINRDLTRESTGALDRLVALVDQGRARDASTSRRPVEVGTTA